MMNFKQWRQVVCGAILLGWALAALGEALEKGPWTGKNLLPVGQADIVVAESPLAAVLVCRHTPAVYDRVSAFEQALQTTATAGIPAFVVIELENEDQLDVVEEIVNQRGFRLPVFGTTDDLVPAGSDCGLFMLTDKEAHAMGGFELTKLVSELALRRPDVRTGHSAEVQTTAPRVAPARNPLYVNQRFDFSIRWPSGWGYRVARNNDGAVGVAPEGSALEARVWAAPEVVSKDPDDPPPYVQIQDYFDYLKQRARGDIKVETKLKVFDGDYEGRDYTYTYVRAGRNGQPDRKYRGRIQAFVVDGVAKIVCVEGPEEEFQREEDRIDKFIYSFRPTTD